MKDGQSITIHYPRPWSTAEVPVGQVVVPKRSVVDRHLIVCSQNQFIYLGPSAEGFTAEELLNGFTMLDGSPCGITEETK